MNPASHIISSGITGFLLGYFLKSWPAAISCFLGGIVIDADHIFDYFLYYKRICWRLSDLENYCLNERGGKMYLILHSYELTLILWILVLYFDAGLIWISFVFGITIHLLFDQVFNDIYPMAYFWFYRSRFGFPKKIFHDPDFRKDYKDNKGITDAKK